MYSLLNKIMLLPFYQHYTSHPSTCNSHLPYLPTFTIATFQYLLGIEAGATFIKSDLFLQHPTKVSFKASHCLIATRPFFTEPCLLCKPHPRLLLFPCLCFSHATFDSVPVFHKGSVYAKVSEYSTLCLKFSSTNPHQIHHMYYLPQGQLP